MKEFITAFGIALTIIGGLCVIGCSLMVLFMLIFSRKDRKELKGLFKESEEKL